MTIPASRIELFDHIDHVAETAGDPKIWVRITSAFHLSKDPGASFALAASLEAAIAMADNLGFGRLAPVAKARPVIQAVSAALREIPELSASETRQCSVRLAPLQRIAR